ncbi:MAG: SUMF1/EgtB/PvdO family nonheme iron enzyme [Spirochaetaceae bacterium]|jgi:formylglycine-generating enzyme required for sulfatase activity|nr:SUMF1/EgtB/PvdO family nonheme iron enzyme [Spirochaetaceae bacterium]
MGKMLPQKMPPDGSGKNDLKDAVAEDQVRLKPLFGVKPGKYLAALYLLVLVVILFFVLVFSGITRRGSMVTFTTEPSGAAVRVDDVFLNTSPCTVFVEEGRRRFDVVLPGFDVFSQEQDVASAIFPRRLSVHAVLGEKKPLYAMILGAEDAAAWSFTGESVEMYQIPLSLSEGVYRSAPADAEAANRLLVAAARFTSTRAFLKDLLRAKFFADNVGRSPSPFNACFSVADIFQFVAGNPAFAVVLAELLGESAKPLLESAWYRKNVIEAVFPPDTGTQGRGSPSGARFGGSLGAGGLRFVEVEGGLFRLATDFGYELPVKSFYIAANEVSDGEWAAFLAENPEWRAENTVSLVQKGLVNGQYMVKPGDAAYPAPAVCGISWFAAEAYCRWLSTKLPPALAGWTVRLPSEIEWEYVAFSVARGLDGGRVEKMVLPDRPENTAKTEAVEAGLWEWCADPFVPIYFLGADAESIAAIGSPKRGVRGGSWINPAGTVLPETRAGLAPSSCSPFVSFRPVIVQEGGRR